MRQFNEQYIIIILQAVDQNTSPNDKMSTQGFSVKRHLHVACAIIELDGKVLAAQRSATMSLPLKWEFPGGKIETGESPEECLQRELKEELGINVLICTALATATHCYPDFTVTLYPFTCIMTGGTITMHEHHALQWIEPLRMPGLDWAAADLPVILEYMDLTVKSTKL